MCIVLFLVLLISNSCFRKFDVNPVHNKLPRFSTLSELKKNVHWYEYLSHLYTDEQIKSLIPLDLGEFWFLYPELMSFELYSSLNWNLFPFYRQGIYALHNPFLVEFIYDYRTLIKAMLFNTRPSELWIYQYMKLPLKRCSCTSYHKIDQSIDTPITLNSYQEIEIFRGPDPPGAFQWFYYAKGSGIWINLGKTIAFTDHHEAFEFFSITHDYSWGERQAEDALGNILLEAEYDSIQFTCCHEQVYKFEIMFTHAKQIDFLSPCTSIQTTGKGGALCACDKAKVNINCNFT